MSNELSRSVIENLMDKKREDDILLFGEQKVSSDTTFDREYAGTSLIELNRRSRYYVKVFGLTLRKSTFYNMIFSLIAILFACIVIFF